MPRPLYLRRKSPHYSLDRKLGGPQSRSWRRGGNSWPYRDSNSDPSVVQPVASRYTNYAIPTQDSPHGVIYYHYLIYNSKRHLLNLITWNSFKQYLEIQVLPHRKYSVSSLKRSTDSFSLGKYFLFILRIIWNTVWENSEFFNVKAGGTHNDHWALNV
jgi:hypothetical protein